MNKSRRDIHAVIGFSHDMLDRLMNPDLTIEQLDAEINRAKAVTPIISQAIDGERVINERIRIVSEYAPEKLVDVMRNQALGYE